MPSLTQNLFDAPLTRLARKSDPVSSRAAAAKVAPRVNGQCARILELIKRHPDFTAGELARLDGDLDQVTICKRVSILERNGLIEVNDAIRKCRVRGNLARTYRSKP